MNFCEYLKSIYDNQENEKDLEKRIPFLELEYWYKRCNNDGEYCQIFVIDENEKILITIGEDIENIYNDLNFILEKNAYIKLWASGVRFGKVTNFEKYFRYSKEDEVFYAFDFKNKK